MSPAVNIDPLLESMETLGECFDHETQAAYDSDTTVMEIVTEEKAELVNQYQTLVEDMLNKVRQKLLSEDQKEALKDSLATLKEKIEENDQALSILETASNRMINLFTDAIREVDSPSSFYDKNGQEKTSKQTTTSIAVSQTI